VQAYATIGFLNLGSGASVFNAARASLADPNAQLYSVLVSAPPACLLAGSLFVCVVAAVSVFGWMPALLGRDDRGLITSSAVVTAVAIGLLAPPSLPRARPSGSLHACSEPRS
jgi:hypothetical protein